jgi:formylglycine-generating enzyme required for sulfatase activity
MEVIPSATVTMKEYQMLYAAWTKALNVSELSIPLIRVEGGTFQMGSPSGGENDEHPVHRVTIDSFYMGKYEVTQDIYEEVMESSPFNWKGARLPVENVTWLEAVQFANALSRRDGFEEVYTINGETVSCDWSKRGYRLPTEAEWEYAARGGKLSGEYIFAGSDMVEDVAWNSCKQWRQDP